MATIKVTKEQIVTEIQQAHKLRTGSEHTFFAPSNMKFFNSKIYDGYYNEERKEFYFITSEAYSERTVAYTVRRAIVGEKGVYFNDVSNFQQYKRLSYAKNRLQETIRFL